MYIFVQLDLNSIILHGYHPAKIKSLELRVAVAHSILSSISTFKTLNITILLQSQFDGLSICASVHFRSNKFMIYRSTSTNNVLCDLSVANR